MLSIRNLSAVVVQHKVRSIEDMGDIIIAIKQLLEGKLSTLFPVMSPPFNNGFEDYLQDNCLVMPKLMSNPWVNTKLDQRLLPRTILKQSI